MSECLSFSLLRWNGNSNQSHVVKGKKTSFFLVLTSLVCRDKMAIKCLFSHLPVSVSQGKEKKRCRQIENYTRTLGVCGKERRREMELLEERDETTTSLI